MTNFEDYPPAIACSDPDTGEQLHNGRPIGDNEMRFTEQEKKEILEKVAQKLDDWELGFCCSKEEIVYKNEKKDRFWVIKLCTADEL